MLTPDVLKSYLLEMPPGHIFELRYDLFAAVFPPGAGDRAAWAALKALAEVCDFVVKDVAAERRIELIKRG
jgi:hypothetical protein